MKLKDEKSNFFTHDSKMSYVLGKCHMIEKVRFFISWGNAWGIHHWPSYLPSIISLFLWPLTSQTLTFRSNTFEFTFGCFHNWVFWKVMPFKALKMIPFGLTTQGFISSIEKKWVTNWCIRYWEYVCNYCVEKIRLKRHMKKHFFHHSLFGNWLNKFQFGIIIQKDATYKT